MTEVRTSVMVMASGPVADRMAGPAIRSWGLAQALSSSCDVTLATPNSDPKRSSAFSVVGHGGDPDLLARMAAAHDVLLVQGYTLAMYPGLSRQDTCIVVDLYDPFTLEDLHMQSQRPMAQRVKANRDMLSVLLQQLRRGDYFICGHDRQRDYWLGMLSASNRLNPQNSDTDATFERLIGVVPFGVPEPPPLAATRPVLKGVHPKVGATDRVVLWVGGIWDWFDPLTPIRTMKRLEEQHPDIKLVFLGVSSPDPSIPRMWMLREAEALSKELGLYDRSVIFIDWVPHADMAGYLLEADLGTYMHGRHLETRYSIRTRMYDYLWAKLPMVVAEGDILGERAATAGVARTVPVGDDAAMAAAVLDMLVQAARRQDLAPRFNALLNDLSWSIAAQPLVEYCRRPARAADHQDPHDEVLAAPAELGELAPVWQLPAKLYERVRRHGFNGLATEIRSSLYRRGFRR